MKYTEKDVICACDIERGMINPKDLIGKKAFYSNYLITVIDYANEKETGFIGKIESVNSNGFKMKTEDSFWNCIILKKEPKFYYRPFELNKEEARNKIFGGVVYDNNSNLPVTVTGFESSCGFIHVHLGANLVDSDYLFQNYHFEDGAPCGEKVEMNE